MAKQQPKKNNNNAIFALEFVGSLLYLAVLFSGAAFQASVWTPVLYGMATVSAVALFFISMANFGNNMDKRIISRGAMSATVFGGFALFSLTGMTAGSGGLFLATLLGFVLGFIGAGIGHQ
jgi:hypothetical protein